MSLCVARQPILDAKLDTVAYELLFRSGFEATLADSNSDHATYSVINNTFFNIGLSNLTRGKRAFINCTRNILLNECLYLLPKEYITIEILELPDDVRREVSGLPHVYDVSFEDSKLVISCSGGKHNLTRVLDVLQKRELSFGRVYTELPTLNDVFLEITGKALRDKED